MLQADDSVPCTARLPVRKVLALDWRISWRQSATILGLTTHSSKLPSVFAGGYASVSGFVDCVATDSGRNDDLVDKQLCG